MPLRQPGKPQVCWYLCAIKVRFPHLTWWTLSDFLQCPPPAEPPLPAWKRWGRSQSEHIYTSGGFKDFVPALIKSFATCFEHLQTIKFPPQQLGLTERFTVFHFPAANDKNPSSGGKGKVCLGELKGLISFNHLISFTSSGLLCRQENRSVLHGLIQVGCTFIKMCQWPN